ncbi:MAG: 4-hydroxythreonine-4-phosphate dehydrogenase PdxA [Candidatus Brocadiaceae bacterium]|jgi:4-hydroxythreonine-4-phosphate dehydrogenase
MLIAVTMGDSSGVGPEIVLHAFQQGEIRHPVLVFGDLDVLRHCNELLGYEVPLREASAADDAAAGCLNVYDLGIMTRDAVAIGRISRESGMAAREYVVAGTEAALTGGVDAVVTLPMNKEATRLSDPRFTGHTELIAGLCGADDVVMMLASEHVMASHVSTHVSMEEAVRRVTEGRVARVIQLTHEAVCHFVEAPRIAVAGLNPHAGEHGLFGREEAERITPAIAWAREQGIDVEGPVPPDTVFYLAVRRNRYDAIVCMYHDQGHVPVKLLDFEGAVNVTLGLPIVRTSVDHGTAFDIAYQGKASTLSFVNALDLAARLTAVSDPP